ncbi:MAG: tyrosine-type recombinase/integrase [Burkholderiales bacterium]
MSRPVHRLSAKTVEKTKGPGYYSDGGGLYLQVSATASRSWIFRYTRRGKSHEMGLGSGRDVSLAEARTRAEDARRQLAGGVEPLAAREGHRAQEELQKAGSISFSECAKKYIDAHKASWRNEKHAEQWQNTLDSYAGPVIGELAVKDVDTALVLRVLEPIWSKKPETASRVRGRIERILDYARVRGYRDGENPARWRGHLDKLLPSALNRKTREHHAALPYDELPAFMRDLRAQGGNAARALELLILTAARTGEIIGCEPEKEMDLKKEVWTIPAGRMKAGKEHRVPLSPQAVTVIEAQPTGTYLFSGGKEGAPLSNMAMLELLRRMGRDDLTVHGFRSTFRDWAAECTSYPGEVCEMALAHAIGDKVEAAYRRGDLFEKRRSLMLDWARYCDNPKGEVVPIARKRAATA